MSFNSRNSTTRPILELHRNRYRMRAMRHPQKAEVGTEVGTNPHQWDDWSHVPGRAGYRDGDVSEWPDIEPGAPCPPGVGCPPVAGVSWRVTQAVAVRAEGRAARGDDVDARSGKRAVGARVWKLAEVSREEVQSDQPFAHAPTIGRLAPVAYRPLA